MRQTGMMLLLLRKRQAMVLIALMLQPCELKGDQDVLGTYPMILKDIASCRCSVVPWGTHTHTL